MPKPVDDLVKTLLEDPKFYPEKSEKDKESTAWAIAWSQYNKNKKKTKKKKKKALSNLNKVITAFEDNGNIQIANQLQEIFTRIASKLY
jgi:hypothetical protein